MKCFCCITGTTIIYSVHVQRHFHVRGMVLQIRLQITGYRHVDILPPHRKFLGVSWTLAGEKKWFVLSILPFGLASTPYVFTRIQKALVKHWREQGIRIFTYLDDLAASRRVREIIAASSFVAQPEKCCWEPTQEGDLLSFILNLREASSKLHSDVSKD